MTNQTQPSGSVGSVEAEKLIRSAINSHGHEHYMPATNGKQIQCWLLTPEEVESFTKELTARAAILAGAAGGAEVAAERERAALICDNLAGMMENGGGDPEPGGRLRQAARKIRGGDAVPSFFWPDKTPAPALAGVVTGEEAAEAYAHLCPVLHIDHSHSEKVAAIHNALKAFVARRTVAAGALPAEKSPSQTEVDRLSENLRDLLDAMKRGDTSRFSPESIRLADLAVQSLARNEPAPSLQAQDAKDAVPGWMHYASRVGSMVVDENGEHMKPRAFSITDMRQDRAFTMPQGKYDLYAYPAGEQPAQFAATQPSAAPAEPECENCNQLARALREATEGPTFMGEPVSRLSQASNWAWTHIKSGGEYSLLGEAKIQCAGMLEDMAEVYVYQAENGDLWARPIAEFNERFKRTRPLVATPPGEVQVQVDAGRDKSLNAKVADTLRPFLKPGQKVIWREPFRWFDDNGVLSNHYDGMGIQQLADDFGYEVDWEFCMQHAAIVTPKFAAIASQSGKGV